MHVQTSTVGTHKVEVGTTRSASGVAQMSQRTLVNGFRKLLLGELFRTELMQLVVIVDPLVISSESRTFGRNAGVSAGRLKGMRRVELLAELQATCSRSQEGSVAVLRQGAQAKASVISTERSLLSHKS